MGTRKSTNPRPFKNRVKNLRPATTLETRLKRIQEVLREIGFPQRYNTQQTARTLLALSDNQSRKGLKSGKVTLADGAVIHDILEYVRKTLRKPVGENTRESYRKGSLKPLRDSGLVQRHQSSPNDPKTYYRLDAKLAELIRRKLSPRWKSRVRGLLEMPPAEAEKPRGRQLRLKLDRGRTIKLSPGKHNELALRFAQDFVRHHVKTAQVAYVGDQAKRKGYQDRDLLREINLSLDVSQAIPDAILVDTKNRIVTVAEFVTSGGPITSSRKKDLEKKLSPVAELGYQVQFVSVFPDRAAFGKFASQLSYGTLVWIAQEPNHRIRFNG